MLFYYTRLFVVTRFSTQPPLSYYFPNFPFFFYCRHLSSLQLQTFFIYRQSSFSIVFIFHTLRAPSLNTIYVIPSAVLIYFFKSMYFYRCFPYTPIFYLYTLTYTPIYHLNILSSLQLQTLHSSTYLFCIPSFLILRTLTSNIFYSSLFLRNSIFSPIVLFKNFLLRYLGISIFNSYRLYTVLPIILTVHVTLYAPVFTQSLYDLFMHFLIFFLLILTCPRCSSRQLTTILFTPHFAFSKTPKSIAIQAPVLYYILSMPLLALRVTCGLLASFLLPY